MRILRPVLLVTVETVDKEAPKHSNHEIVIFGLVDTIKEQGQEDGARHPQPFGEVPAEVVHPVQLRSTSQNIELQKVPWGKCPRSIKVSVNIKKNMMTHFSN
jgi:hypothetical protein